MIMLHDRNLHQYYIYLYIYGVVLLHSKVPAHIKQLSASSFLYLFSFFLSFCWFCWILFFFLGQPTLPSVT